MRSYLAILTELKDTVESDSIPERDKAGALQLIDALMKTLWQYSD